MRDRWAGEEFRGVRVALVLAGFAATGLCFDMRYGSTPSRASETLVSNFTIASILFAGPIASLTLERGGWVARLIGVLLLAPTLWWGGVFLLWIARDFAWGDPTAMRLGGLLAAALLLHLVQLWRLAGIAFPRLPEIEDTPAGRMLAGQAIPTSTPGTGAERTAAR